MIDIRQNSFAGGVWARSLHGRVDLARYLVSVKEARNFIVNKHGNLTNRPGTRFIASVRGAGKARLVPFMFADGQNFVLEFSDQFIRFYLGGGQVLATGAPTYTGATSYAKDAWVTYAGLTYRSLQAANVAHQPDVSPTWWEVGTTYEITSPYLEAELPRLKFAQMGDIITICHANHAPMELRRYGNIDWRLVTIDFSVPANNMPMVKANPETGGGYTHFMVPTVDGLFVSAGHIKFDLTKVTTGSNKRYDYAVTQILRFADGSVKETLPFKYTTSITTGVLTTYTGAVVKPSNTVAAWSAATTYAQGNAVTGSDGRVYISAAGGNLGKDPVTTVFADWWYPLMVGGVNPTGGVGYPAGWVGDPLGQKFSLSEHKPEIYWGGLTVPAGATLIGTRLYRGLGNTFGLLIDIDPSITSYIDDGTADPDFTVNPPIGANPFTSDFPDCVAFYEQRRVFGRRNNVLASRTADFTNFDPPLVALDDSPLDMLLAALRYEEIRWLLPSRLLLAGTSAAPWAIGGIQGAPLTPTSRSARPQNSYGSAWLDPVMVGNGALYVQDMGNLVREVIFDYSTDSYQGNEISALASHLFEDAEIVSWTYAQMPFSVVWMVQTDGTMLGLSYDKANELVAWHWHDTVGSFEDVCAVQEGEEHAVYVIVNRTNGRYVERFESRKLPKINDVVDVPHVKFLDSALTYEGTPATTVTGLNHLEGETVMALADGAPTGPYVVVSGEIDISVDRPDGAEVITVGLPYNADMEQLDVVTDKAEVKSKRKRTVKVDVELMDTIGLQAGNTFTTLKDWAQRTVADGYGNVPVFNGVAVINIPGKYDYEGRVCLRQALPLPITILGITREVDLGDD